ncbi:TrmH family RNA methyltransferase, partial [filamentous cyanobacterium CCP5]
MSPVRTQYPNLRRHALMVCATLVENPINLGMLCRTAEAFRLEALVLSDLKLAQDRKFRQGAVATHQWQPLMGCAPDHLPQWLHQQRQRGYTPIALDLQPQAVPLTDLRFPERAVLVLGRELTGIPAAVAAACDQVVMIPQYGV